MVGRDDFEGMEDVHGMNPYDYLDGNSYDAIYAWIQSIDDVGLLNATKAVELKAFDGRPGILEAIKEQREVILAEEEGGDD